MARDMSADPQQETVAYLMGSFWFCPPCAQKRDDAAQLEAARRADLMDVYTYHCDQCRKPIR